MKYAELVSEDSVQSRPLYHGTYKANAAEKIMSDGFTVSDIQGKRSLAPMAGRVYMTPSLHYAIIYAIGGDYLGSTLDKPLRPDETYGYVFEISPDDLSADVLPDEDVVGEILTLSYEMNTKPNEEQSGELANELRNTADLIRTFAHMFNQYTADVLPMRRAALDGEYHAWARIGKRVLKKLDGTDPRIKAMLQLKTTHQSHRGDLAPTRAWRIDRRLTSQLAKDGSNFFDVATKIYDRN